MLLENKIFQSIATGVIPIITATIDHLTGEWVIEGKIVNLYQTGKLWVLVLYILFVVLVISFAVIDHKKNNTLKEFEKQKKENVAYEKEIATLRDVFDFSQNAINKLTKNFEQNKKLDLREWNFEAVATYICKGVYAAISATALKGTNFTVNIYVKDIDENRKEYITMIAHEGENREDPPNIFGVKRLLKPGKSIHYSMRQFVDNNPKMNVLATKAEIRRAFSKYKESYNQYIGIPICCKGNNMISLLEIIAHDDSKIADNKDEIIELIKKYVITYQYFALLAHKVEKNMVTAISVMEKKEELKNDKAESTC